MAAEELSSSLRLWSPPRMQACDCVRNRASPRATEGETACTYQFDGITLYNVVSQLIVVHMLKSISHLIESTAINCVPPQKGAFIPFAGHFGI